MYDLARLGNDRFEHMVQALAIGTLGPGVTVFGAGPDGGREATFNGPVDMDGAGQWNGYGVIQAKYKTRLTTTTDDQSWFFNQVTAELDGWINQKKKRYNNQPEYLVFVTNVHLTSVDYNGGQDRLQRLIEYYRDLTYEDDDRIVHKIGIPKLKGYVVWAADTLDRLLENNTDVRRAYADLVLPGDLLTRLFEQLEEDDDRLVQAWVGHVERAVRADASVELGESGDETNSPLPLAAVAVDLPAGFGDASSSESSYALAKLVERGEMILQPALRPRATDRIVMLGGPGSGKSTLSRLLCQIYRLALLTNNSADRLTVLSFERAQATRTALDQAGIPTPTLHRLPIRVVLSAFADAVAGYRKLTLLQYIVELINDRASDPISVADAKRIIKAWPVLIVLDGMDEVASPENRERVSALIVDFLADMAALRADVLLLTTSRPVGFEHNTDIGYQELVLAPLAPREALRYADRLLSTRFADNHDRHEQTLERLQDAARRTDIARLMTSPLQVTILSLLLEQRRQAPDSRYRLFDSYYNTIYARETNKVDSFGEVLEAHRTQLDELHERCGLAIHRRAEHAGEAESILPLPEMEAIALAILIDHGHPEADRQSLIESLLVLARERLVLLVPRNEGLSFEVRTLAEFFAARALMAGEDAGENLQLMVPSAHWRHTWLLAAGNLFANRRGMRDTVLARLVAADQSSATHRLVLPGAELAIDALQDGFAAATPRWEQQLALSALRLVHGPVGEHITRLADTLARGMQQLPELNAAVWRELNESTAEAAPPQAFRAFLAGLAASDTTTVSAKATEHLARHDESHGGPGSAPRGTSKPSSGTPAIAGSARSILDKLRQLGVPKPPIDPSTSESAVLYYATQSLSSSTSRPWLPAARELIAEGCRGDARLRPAVRKTLAAAIARDEIGPILGESTDADVGSDRST